MPINLIRNASVCSNIILKNLYWSEFGFLVSFWLNFHFFVFSNSTYFESGSAQGRPTLWQIWSKVGRPRAVQLSKWLKFSKLEKKSFLLKNIFFFAFYARPNFFDEKYASLTLGVFFLKQYVQVSDPPTFRGFFGVIFPTKWTLSQHFCCLKKQLYVNPFWL